MTLSPNIILGNEYVTAYFADQIWPKTLKDHRKRWDEAAKTGDPNPRTRLSGLSTTYFKLKPDAADGNTDTLAELCARIVDALGYDVDFNALGEPELITIALTRGDDLIDVPCIAAVTDRNDNPILLAVQADTFTTDPSLLITSDTKPTRRPHRHGQPDKPEDGTDTIPGVVNAIYATGHPPRWVLIVAGGAATLVDHKPWLDGKWLGANVDDILSNNDRTAGGEIDQFTGWFSTAGTIPDEDGTSLLDTAVDGSQRQAVGVSESLRDAVRAGVEAIANEVLYDRRFRLKKSVFGEQGGVTVDAADLARQSIRWMYRLVVLLYAEARPNIGILPTTADGTTLYDLYESGYGLERLRQLSLVELESEAARNGTHIHQSLDLLFRLVNEGHQRPNDVELTADGDDPWTGIEFTPLNSRLFGPKSCPDIDGAQLRDHVLQQVVAGLCFTPGEKGKGRQAVSYANLEVNQLGAVYEGLMAYTGFIALEDRNEVAARTKGDNKDGVARSADPSRGSWTIPVIDADRYPDNVFVTETDPDTGESRPIVHEKGSFVFRLAGRDRARSASFYTPSVLTEFTVRHALEEWQANHPDLTAAAVLQMTILEPALGSGAFANEACDQAAELYLRLRESETGETVPAEDRAIELRKLRAHFAINQTYGVDLNDTGVELAEVSLWLNSMHPGLAAPPLSHRLRRGNSLIGCTRSTYTEDQVAKQPWKGDVFPPTDKPLSEHPLGTQGIGIHHFLLPGEGWGAAAKTGKSNPCREFASEWCERVWDWKKEIQEKPSKVQVARSKQIADKIEALWAATVRDVEAHLNAQNRPIAVWNDPGVTLPLGDSTRFRDPNGPYQRLKTIMDAWCAFWMWAPEHGTALPSLDQWLDFVDYLCGSRNADADDRLFGEHSHLVPRDSERSESLFETETTFDTSTRIAEAIERWPWLSRCVSIARRQGFFHWEVEFPLVFRMAGFGLTVGNPPWVPNKWDEYESLAEFEPWFGTTNLKSALRDDIEDMKRVVLESDSARRAFLQDAAENQGSDALLSSTAHYHALSGSKVNLYQNFLVATLRYASSTGVVALIHPEKVFNFSGGAAIRRLLIPRLRRHWQFRNSLFLFRDIADTREYSVCVYSCPRSSPSFQQAANLLHPSVLDQSRRHDGGLEVPGIKTPEGDWDLRPHRERIVNVDESVLAAWADLFDPEVSSVAEVRLQRPHTSLDLEILDRLARHPTRVGNFSTRHWALGFDEGVMKKQRFAEFSTHRPSIFTDCILQGPHITPGCPLAQEPRPICNSTNDWDPLDLTALGPDFVPRVNFRRSLDPAKFDAERPSWDGSAYTGYFREAHREYVDPVTERTLQAAILPPGVDHIGKVNSNFVGDERTTIRWACAMAGLPYDYLTKTTGLAGLGKLFTDQLPVPHEEETLDAALMLRGLRLNCLVRQYAPLWERYFQDVWREDSFSVRGPGELVEDVAPTWTQSTPLRTEWSRWIALAEVDALVALHYALSEDQLAQMYRSQFARLRQYEWATVFDGAGQRVASSSFAYDRRQSDFEDDLKNQPTRRGETKLKLWERVEAFRDGDNDVALAYLVPPFRRADRELAMRTAYRAFAERSGKTEGVSTDPLPEWEIWG